MDKKIELAIDLGQVIYTNTINSLTQQRDELRRQLAEKDAEIARLKGDTYAGLVVYPNNTESEQQRILAGSVEMGQLLERGKDEGAGNTKPQGIIVLAGIDEYGPILHWHTHWVDFEVGSEFYSDKQLAASQAREVQLREALGLNVVRNPKYPWKQANNWDNCPACFEMFDLDKCEHCGSGYDDEYIRVKESTDTSALEALIAKSGEVMRERCAEYLENNAQALAEEYGSDDLGSLSFGSGAAADLRMDTFSGWMEDAQAIRALPGVTLEDLTK